jgi:hypothetical protein
MAGCAAFAIGDSVITLGVELTSRIPDAGDASVTPFSVLCVTVGAGICGARMNLCPGGQFNESASAGITRHISIRVK